MYQFIGLDIWKENRMAVPEKKNWGGGKGTTIIEKEEEEKE